MPTSVVPSKENTDLTCSQLDEMVKAMIKRRNDLYTVKISWLGIYFDVNDLGLVAGVSLVVILLALNYALMLKYQNIKRAITFIKENTQREEHRKYFEVLSTAQTLTLPSDSEKLEFPGVLKFVPRILFALPAFAHIFVLVYDVISAARFDDISPYHVWISTGMTAVLFGIIDYQIISCYIVDSKTDVVWIDFKKEYYQRSIVP